MLWFCVFSFSLSLSFMILNTPTFRSLSQTHTHMDTPCHTHAYRQTRPHTHKRAHYILLWLFYYYFFGLDKNTEINIVTSFMNGTINCYIIYEHLQIRNVHCACAKMMITRLVQKERERARYIDWLNIDCFDLITFFPNAIKIIIWKT